MKVGDIIESVKDCRFGGVVEVFKGHLCECIEIGDVNERNPFLEGTFVRINTHPDLFFCLEAFRVVEFPDNLEIEIKEALEAPVIIIETV